MIFCIFLATAGNIDTPAISASTLAGYFPGKTNYRKR